MKIGMKSNCFMKLSIQEKTQLRNEGLTSADNKKIAALKLKFAPMYTLNRMGAKSEENAAAKQ